MFLPTEIVIDLGQMQALRSALDALQFQPVEEARFLHFAKPWGEGGRIKIDLLTGPIDDAALAALKLTRPRVRPRGQLNLHAYLTGEAIDFDTSLLPLNIEGIGSNGQQGTVTVHIPQPFTFLLMKLHAFADRTEDHDRDLGRHHALDVYRIVAMLTAEEYADVRTKVILHERSSAVHRAREIVAGLFSSPIALGGIRVREHELYTNSMDLGLFLSALDDLFHR